MKVIYTLEIDCHEHPYDGCCGYASLVEIAERYGVKIEDTSSAHPLASWAWWYRVTGPADNLRRFLVNEYGDDETAAVLVANATVADIQAGNRGEWQCEQCGRVQPADDPGVPVEAYGGLTFHLCAACAIGGAG